ncbi:hypothetical protein HY36_15820 [Hyphomonas atlantica]|uniref:Uncharacterized protein n=1 Tax=Hyphomonas atlantica TaxID=1280948 RepID=A0A059E4G5_9PROT|nr:hypothetical protein HY36_15820 [Hyphomonas atlantica]
MISNSICNFAGMVVTEATWSYLDRTANRRKIEWTE